MRKVRHLFIIVPSASMASPVKGAAALANALIDEMPVSFVSLKPATEGFRFLDDRVERISLSESGAWPARLSALRRRMREAGGRPSVASVSFCLSADFINTCCRDLAITCTSVRGNLPEVYPETYGKIGKWIAVGHLNMLRRLDHVVSMTESMSQQVQRYIGRPSPVISNFVDETLLAKFRSVGRPEGPLRIVFTGSMLPGKQPHLVLHALRSLQERGLAVRLDAYGAGPLLSDLRQLVRTLPEPEAACFHGHVNEPYKEVSEADVLVLPSKTEGMSRSALEALFLGVPCVMRDVDGNSELIRPGVNGGLFRDDDQLTEVVLDTAEWSRKKILNRACLLPREFRQEAAAGNFLKLLNGEEMQCHPCARRSHDAAKNGSESTWNDNDDPPF